MAIRKTAKSNPHWNYFIALEHDLEAVSRYIEFSEHNFNTYSIELAHLLLTAASEVDVLAKCICEIFEGPHANIYDYQKTITAPDHLPGISDMQVFIPRYGLTLTPWENWAKAKNPPDWWHSYNNVKHKRNTHFQEATLKHVLNALGALLIMNFHHQSVPSSFKYPVNPVSFTRELKPDSTLLRLRPDYYEGYSLLDTLVTPNS
jgi:hypothetical protein